MILSLIFVQLLTEHELLQVNIVVFY